MGRGFFNMVTDPECNICGDAENHLGYLDSEPLCHKCWNEKTREQGMRSHEVQEWHDKLDRVIAGTESYNTHGTEEEQE